jgi:hypothetical protein
MVTLRAEDITSRVRDLQHLTRFDDVPVALRA